MCVSVVQEKMFLLKGLPKFNLLHSIFNGQIHQRLECKTHKHPSGTCSNRIAWWVEQMDRLGISATGDQCSRDVACSTGQFGKTALSVERLYVLSFWTNQCTKLL